jgi:hypothetical protein
MAQFKVSILLIVVIITLKSSPIMAQNNCLQPDTILLCNDDFKILANDEYHIDIEIIQKSKIKEIASKKKPIFCFHIEGHKCIAKGNKIFESSVPEKCDYFYPIDEQNKVILFNDKLSLIKVR